MSMFVSYYLNYVVENYSRAMKVIQENVINEGKSIFSRVFKLLSNKLKSIFNPLVEYSKMLLRNRVGITGIKSDDIDLADFEVVNMEHVQNDEK